MTKRLTDKQIEKLAAEGRKLFAEILKEAREAKKRWFPPFN